MRARGRPWITLTKTLGTDWEPIARRLAERLGWAIFDREIVKEIARRSHVPESLLSSRDEREVGWIEEGLAGLASKEHPSQYLFHEQMARVILEVGRRGGAIVLGHGANWLLPVDRGLRVRLLAPLPERIARVSERESLPPSAARARVRRDDAARARFILQFYRRRIDDLSGYDLVVNTAALARDGAVAVILAALDAKCGPVARRDPPRVRASGRARLQGV